MNKEPRIFLEHILESIEWIEKDTQHLTKEDFLANVPIQDAVIRRIEIIGQAIRNLSNEFKQSHQDTPWQDIMDMRNKLIHEYFGVDINLIWRVVKNDIPPLKEQIHAILTS